ncbi:hypothetical protein L596_024630 [Steinernema carpocapsae]|uniref:Uncharacterized protein n=1 Tax=Steinernema carpocapsae TaxID=34508 RepID=A0A4U5M679_STECR|nr:hypothetical protein L596_024630 [Steinernema carpocapsae]
MKRNTRKITEYPSSSLSCGRGGSKRGRRNTMRKDPNGARTLCTARRVVARSDDNVGSRRANGSTAAANWLLSSVGLSPEQPRASRRCLCKRSSLHSLDCLWTFFASLDCLLMRRSRRKKSVSCSIPSVHNVRIYVEYRNALIGKVRILLRLFKKLLTVLNPNLAFYIILNAAF